MAPLSVVFLAGALLLVAAGCAKVVSPTSTVDAARRTGLPLTPMLGRLFGLVEIGVGMAAVVWPHPAPASAVALTYLGFAGFVAWGLRSGALESCGCFPGERAEPSGVHVATNLILSGAALSVASSPLAGALTEAGRAAPALAVLAAAMALLLYLLLAHLPRREATSHRLAVSVGQR